MAQEQKFEVRLNNISSKGSHSELKQANTLLKLNILEG